MHRLSSLRHLPAFDVLADLARNNPAGLEVLRNRLTDEVIRHARSEPARRRLEGIKFRIDMERRRARDPLAACVRISVMMHRSLANLQAVLVQPDAYRGAKSAAAVIGFPRQPE